MLKVRCQGRKTSSFPTVWILKICQTSGPDVMSDRALVPNSPKWSQMVPNGAIWSRIDPNGPKLKNKIYIYLYIMKEISIKSWTPKRATKTVVLTQPPAL